MLNRSSYLVLCLAMLSLQCKSNSPMPPPASTTTAITSPAQKKFESPDAGISFYYPGNWKPVTGTQSQLKIAPPDDSHGNGVLTLDIPTLPFHIPGLIPIDQVRNGYVKDAKKKIPDATVTDFPDPAVPDAKQRWVKLTGDQNSKPAINEGVLIVHNDKVYVLSVEGDLRAGELLHNTLESTVKSIQWTK